MMNLSWKPPKIKETIINKWVPGMSIPKDNDNDNSIYSVKNISIDLNNKLYELKQEPNSTIRITNLPYYIRIKDLADLFDLYGRIEERGGIKIKEYPDSTMAFIKYVYPEAAIKAIDNMDGYPIDHYIIKVELALQR